MEAKRMRFNENVLPNINQISQIQSSISRVGHLELGIWQNRLIEECVDDNFINSFLESTRDHIQRQNNQGQQLEDQAIDQAINTIGLKKPSLLNDEEDSSTDSFDNLPSSHLQNSSLEEFAIDSAIRSYGLHKKSI